MITSGRPKSHETLPDMTANDSHEQERTAKVQSDEQSPTENAVEIWEATEPQWEGDRPEIIAAKPSLFQRLRRNRSDDVIVPKVDDFPCGYPRQAAYIESDANYAQYRLYKYLRHRCLLYVQDELAVLERRLERFDKEDSLEDPLLLKSRLRDDDQSLPRRADLLADIKRKLHEYDELLFKTKELMHWRQPTPRNRRSYVNHIQNERLFAGKEGDFIKYGEDLAALGGELEDSWLNGAVEDTLNALSKRVAQFFFRSQTQRKRTDHSALVYYDKGRLDFFIRIVMTVVCSSLLMIPIVVLYYSQQAGFQRDLVVLGFTLLFAIFLSIFTQAKRHELFAATAGYCAVLVVFLSNSSFSM